MRVATPAVIRACKEMLEGEHVLATALYQPEYPTDEIVGRGREFWLGLRRVSPVTVNMMLRLGIVSSEGLGTSCERHTLNSEGRKLAMNPDYVPGLVKHFAKELSKEIAAAGVREGWLEPADPGPPVRPLLRPHGVNT